jgi:hypothetical protein
MTNVTIRSLSVLAALGILLAAANVATAQADLASTAPAQAKLKCKDVKGRWQICGDAKPFKSISIGVGIHFNKKKPGLAANSAPTQPTAPVAPKNSLRR